jgi:hypothetical protein
MSARWDITAESLLINSFRQLHAGDDFTHIFLFTRGGTALDLTGATVRFTVKEDTVETDAQAKLLYDSGTVTELEITDAVGGEITLKLQSADTQDLEGLWLYDIQATFAGGSVMTLARGRIEFLPNLTRTTP